MLLIVISINIVLALVTRFPTNLVSLNSKSVCRSCVSFGVLIKAEAVLPLVGAVLPLGGDVIFFTSALRSGTAAWSSTTVATSTPDQNLVTSPAVVGTDVFFSTTCKQ